jgi:protein-S-isoprenylcysteine O-methyltransferase Ste14
MTWIYCAIIIVLVIFSRPTLGVGLRLAIFTVGLILVSIASVGRLWCMLYISGYKTKKLIVEGPYSLCRNPLYFFSFLGVAGLGLTTESLLYTTVLIVPFFVLYPWVIRHEEAKLLARHPDEYPSYFQ